MNSSKMSLSELCDRYYGLEETLSSVDPNTLPPELEDSLKELQENRDLAQAEYQQKVDNYLELMKSREGWVSIRKERIAELQRLIEIDENLVKKLGDRLLTIMVERDERQMRTANFNLSVVSNGGKLPLYLDEQIDLDHIPPEYLKTEVRQKIDKDKVRGDLEQGKKINFASLGDRGKHLRVR